MTGSAERRGGGGGRLGSCSFKSGSPWGLPQPGVGVWAAGRGRCLPSSLQSRLSAPRPDSQCRCLSKGFPSPAELLIHAGCSRLGCGAGGRGSAGWRRWAWREVSLSPCPLAGGGGARSRGGGEGAGGSGHHSPEMQVGGWGRGGGGDRAWPRSPARARLTRPFSLFFASLGRVLQG